MVGLTWVALAELLRGGAHLTVHDALVLLFLGVGLKTLPRKATSDKVHEDITQRLEVVATALL